MSETTEYAILLQGREADWLDLDEAGQARIYDSHRAFAAALAEHGHEITAGAELADSRHSWVVRGEPGSTSVTAGPYLESVEQVGGFYTVRTADRDGLLELCGLLAGTGPVEVRVVVSHAA